MAERPRNVVLPFEPPARRRAEDAPCRVPARAGSAAPWLDGLADHDQVVNADWDRLVTLTMQAWCWRDPESIAALVACLRRLRDVVDRDWS